MKKSKKKELSAKSQGSAPPVSFAQGNIHFLLPAILFGALLVRIYALSNFSNSLYGDFLIYDEQVYQSWAESILAGKSFVVHAFSPLPAYVMAGVYRLFGIDTDYVRMVNILLGVFTCLFIYFIGRDLADRTIGLIACLIASLYKPFIFFSITVLKESLGLFLFSAAIYLFISLMKDMDPPPVTQGIQEEGQGKKDRSWVHYASKFLFLGITVGLLINVRQNCVALLPVFPLFLLWMMYKKVFPFQKAALTITVYVVGIVLSLSPFLIRNYYATGEFRASPAGGFNLYLGNNLNNPLPYYRPAPFATSSPTNQATQFIIEASRRVGKKLSPREASSFWTREVIKIAEKRPGALAWKIWQKTLVLFNRSEADVNYDLGFISRFIPIFRLPFFAFWFVFPLGMAWMILSIRKSRKALALSAVFLVYALTLIAVFSSMRIRIPLLVILIPYAAMGFDRFFKVMKRQIPMAETYRYLIVIALLTVIEFLPITGTGDMAGHYNTHAINLDSKGFKGEAFKYWKESSAMKESFSAYANLALAAKYYQRNDYIKGNLYLDQIPDDSFAAADKYNLLGDSLAKQKQNDKAIAAYEKSLQINSGLIQVRMKLINLCEERNPQKAQEEKAYLAYIQSFYKGPGG